MAIKECDPLKTKLEKIARAFNEPPHTILPIAPTKPDSPNDPISLPPSAIMEVINPTDPQQIVNERLTEVEAKTFDTPTSIDAQPPLTKPQNPPDSKPSNTKQKEQNIMQEEQTLPLLEQEQVERVENVERVETKRRRGRPKGSKNKKTIMAEKLSQIQAQGEREEPDPDSLEQPSMDGDFKRETKKLSRTKKLSHNEPLPVDLSVGKFTGVKGKTSLCYALLYAQALTPGQIDTLLAKSKPLRLTTAEVIALKLLKRTEEGDPKAEKIYWEILKNEQKNAKITPVKSENSLLDEALEKAESAILGEIVVDNETNP